MDSRFLEIVIGIGDVFLKSCMGVTESGFDLPDLF
jgi:hypothetical protein